MKNSEEIMEILEAYDLTGSLRGAAVLAGCDHKTVAHYVALREAGAGPDERAARPMLIDEFLGKVEEWMDRSQGKVRADVVHDKLVAMGFAGSERTTRRAVAAARRRWWSGHRRVFRPWVPEPGLWTGVRLGRRAHDRGPADSVVLRLAGLVAVPGGAAVLGPDATDPARLPGRDAAAAGWGADVCVDR